MALTLVEAAKTYAGDPIRSGIIEMYARGSDILRVLPFMPITGSAIKFNQEHTLPGVGFRSINEAYEESTGVVTPVTEGLVIAGGDLDVDRFLVKNMGESQRTTREGMKMKALALSWSKTFIKGDQSTNAKEFNGLQKRISGNQLIAAGTTQNGDPLSLSKVDQAMDGCSDPTHLCMSKAMRRIFTVAARSAAISGNITYGKDEFGRQVTFYNDLPIIIFDEDNEDNLILGFNELCPSGGTLTGQSIYIVSLGDGKVSGLQSGDPVVTDMGMLQSKPVYRTRVEWDTGLVVFNPKAAVRIWGISDAAITA